MKKIVLEGYIEVPENELDSVLEELPTHVRLTENEPGCICFNVVQRQDEPRVFDVYEEFESQEAFDLHQSRVKTSAWGTVTVNVSRNYEITEVEYS